MISESLATALRWALPPVLGAIIGYVTNALAIRMLFRPLTEKRVFGVRIPFTPGVIPGRRYELAESIGRMVSEHLITQETVDEHLSGESFRAGLKESVRTATASVLSSTPQTLRDSTADLVGTPFLDLVATLLRGFLRSRGFLTSVRTLVTRIVSFLGGKNLVSVATSDSVKGFVRRRLVPLVTTNRERIIHAATDWLQRHMEGNTPLGQILPESFSDSVVDLIHTSLPTMRQALLRWLRTDTMRNELAMRGRFLVKDILDKMNVFQKFFVSMAQYDRNLDEKMPEIVNDLIDYLEEIVHDKSVVQRLLNVIRSALVRLRSQGIGDFLDASGVDWRTRLPEGLERLLSKLDAERVADRVDELVDGFYRENGGRTLRELTGRYLSMQEQEVVESISVAILEYLTKDETAGSITRTIGDFLTGLTADGSAPGVLGEILGIEDSRKDQLDEFLFERVQGILSTRLPAFVQGFDVRQMVVDRVNRLDVARVEDLLMLVIQRHLKWINVFGAMLGGLIGFSQSLVSQIL